MSTRLAVASALPARPAPRTPSERAALSATTSPALLLASACGTAIAAVCATGLLSLTGSAPGIWAGLAVLCGGVLAWLLANALAFLAAQVPSRAGLLAYLGRGLGRRAALLLTLPYLLASLFLVGAEASVVGRLLARAAGGPAALHAFGFIVITYLLCRRGIQLGLRLQALCTVLLMAGLALLALSSLAPALHTGSLWPRLFIAPPSLSGFIGAVSQALFLFMGFELITSQTQPSETGLLRGALRGSALLLTGFYALLALAFVASALADPAHIADLGGHGALVPQLALAEAAAGRPAVWLIAGLSLLASYTSVNGALLSLSRLMAALATLGYLPAQHAQIDAASLLPQRALRGLLLVALLATAVIHWGGLLLPAILATAPLAALVYAGLAWAQQAPVFASAPQPRRRRLVGRGLALVFTTIALGSIAALADQPTLARPVLILLFVAYAATLSSLALPVLRRFRGSR